MNRAPRGRTVVRAQQRANRQRAFDRNRGLFANAYRAGQYAAPFLYDFAGRMAQKAAVNAARKVAGAFMATPGPSKTKKRTAYRKSTLGTYAGKTKRSTKKGMNVAVNKYAKYGVVTNRETTDAIEDEDCVYVGHSSVAVSPLIRTAWYAVIKKLFAKAGIQIRDFTEIVELEENYRVELFLRSTENDDILSYSNISYTAGVATYEAVANDKSLWVLNNYFDTVYENLRFHEIILVQEKQGQEDVLAKLILDQMNIHYFSKSTLRMQNRTQPAGIEGVAEADDVNNVPLTGRSYLCKGANPVWTGRSLGDVLGTPNKLYGFVIDAGNGFIQKAAQQETNWNQYDSRRRALREPVLPKNFKNCYKSAKQRLQPGQIKISTLYDSRKMDFNYFHYSVRTMHALINPNLPRVQVRCPLGKCELFAFEEMISFGTQKVNVTWEVDRDMGCMLVAKKTPITSKLNFT